MSALYTVFNGPMPTTAALTPITTGTAIKTMLQIKLGTGIKGKIVEWTYSYEPPASATTARIELIETGTVFGTVTASVAADIMKTGDPNDISPTTSNFIVGTTSTGYTCTSEGSITATRLHRYADESPAASGTNIGGWQWPLGREPVVDVSTALRVRTTFGVAALFVTSVTIEI